MWGQGLKIDTPSADFPIAVTGGFGFIGGTEFIRRFRLRRGYGRLRNGVGEGLGFGSVVHAFALAACARECKPLFLRAYATHSSPPYP